MSKAKDMVTQDSSGGLQPASVSRWNIDDMTGADADEARAIRDTVDARKRRPSLHYKTDDAGRTLAVGKGSDANKTLNSMRLFEAAGSGSGAFSEELLWRLSKAITSTGNDERDSVAISAAMALVAAVGPENELEATMAVQMVAANEAALLCFERLRTAGQIEHVSAYSNMANKAMRSFALHAEALAKLRRGGEQIVKHVHVNSGGQAIVAETFNAGGGA